MSGKTVTVACAECKSNFERSVFNPYMKTCPSCRGVKVKAPKPRIANGQSAFAAKLLIMADKGITGSIDADGCVYKQKNGELYFRLGTRKFFSRKAFVEAHGL